MKKSLLSIISLLAVATVAMAEEKQEYYELRTYHFASAEKAALFDKTAKEALMPALKRLGIGPVGVFQLQKGEKFEGEEDKVLRMVVIPHQTLESVGSLGEKLGEDSAFLEAAGDYLSSAIKDPVFTRMQSTLMHAFKAWPKVVVPKPSENPSERFYELRIYESHNEERAKKKVDMFNAGEIPIFNDAGLRSVFYGESLVGENLPNLTYMLVHENKEAHKKAWQAFIKAPAWKEMSSDPQYKDTVSKIKKYFLTGLDYSALK